MQLLEDDFIQRIVQSVKSDHVRDPFEDEENVFELQVPLDPVARLTAQPGPERTVPTSVLAEQPSFLDMETSTKQERAQGQETFEQMTPGSSGAFAAAQAATGMSPESWFKKWGGGASGDLSGFIPEKALMKVGEGHYLKPDAGKAFKAMLRAAKRDGINIAYTDTYRDYDTQVATKAAKGAYAATPGHSNHGWGMAVDFNVNDPKVKAWLDKNGKKFGWVNPEWAHDGEGIEEPWHWEYVGGGKQVRVRKPKKGHKGHAHHNPIADPLNKLESMSSLNSPTAVFGKLLDEVEAPTHRARTQPDKDAPKNMKGIKGQLYAGFMEAGRKDLAKMVFTKEFDVWIRKESGWNPENVSPANNQGRVNGGLFQFWFGTGTRNWVEEWFKKGGTSSYDEGNRFTASPYQQAIFAARYFDLTPQDIRTYAAQIAAGTYKGWG